MSLLNTLGNSQLPITLQSGDGPLLWDDQGNEYWDFYGGHAVTLIGNSHPKLTEAISKQAQQLSFCTTISDLGIRQVAAQKLCEFTGTDVAWFVNSGAEANEGALKMARKHTGRPVIVAMVKGFTVVRWVLLVLHGNIEKHTIQFMEILDLFLLVMPRH